MAPILSLPANSNAALTMWENLELIRSLLELEVKDFADILRVTEKEYVRLRRSKHSLSVDSALAIAERLNVGFDSIIMGNIDYQAMKSQFCGDRKCIPGRYSSGAMSKVRSAGTFLKYIETTYGSAKRSLILRKHQFTEEALSDLDSFVSVRFASDLCRYVYKFSQSTNEIMNMGSYSAVTYSNTAFGKEIRAISDVREAYSYVIGDVVEKYIERNFSWKVEDLTREGCRVVGTPNLSPSDCFTTHDPLMCLLRLGFVSSISAFMGMALSKTVKTKCIWSGDPYCEMQVNFAEKSQSLASMQPSC